MPNRARHQITINDADGRPVATADIEIVDLAVVRTALHVESGHLPVGSRKRLVDAVFDDPEVSSRQQVQVALPLGDTEILDRVRERCIAGEARAAGSTCLVQADLPHPHATTAG